MVPLRRGGQEYALAVQDGVRALSELRGSATVITFKVYTTMCRCQQQSVLVLNLVSRGAEHSRRNFVKTLFSAWVLVQIIANLETRLFSLFLGLGDKY